VKVLFLKDRDKNIPSCAEVGLGLDSGVRVGVGVRDNKIPLCEEVGGEKAEVELFETDSLSRLLSSTFSSVI
jgi:hypothetical protein